jgi:hypothetical protein
MVVPPRPKEMLKLKIDPTIYMKTKSEGQNVHPEMQFFAWECTH